MSRHLRCLCLLLVTACAAAPLRRTSTQTLDTALGRFELSVEDDGTSPLEQVELPQALERASLAVTRWGTLNEPVALIVVPTHAALERAIKHPGYPELRAWSTYGRILLQAPRTWTWNRPDLAQLQLEELLRHELTHCVMFQQSSGSGHWKSKRIAYWFREGMASYTANQGYFRMSLGELRDFYRDHPGVKLLQTPERYDAAHHREVYSASHRAFLTLVDSRGEEAVRHILARMREGADFDAAFLSVIGETSAAFADHFEEALR